MDMRQVNVGCIVRNGMLAIAVLTMCGARAAAQEGAPYAAAEPAVAAAPPPPPPPPPPPAQTTAVAIIEPNGNYWMASGFAGTNFSANTQNVDVLDIDDNGAATFSFGGQVGYLWKGIFGVSGLLDFSPSIDVQSLAFSGSPSVSAYMANVVIAYPIGAERQYQPYVSGGFGAIRMSTDVLNLFIPEALTPALDFTSVSQTKFGANIGAGLAAFLGGSRFGLLTDVRYFHAASDNTLADDVVLNDLLLDESLLGDELSETSRADAVIRRVLSGLGYWRANVGLAVRW